MLVEVPAPPCTGSRMNALWCLPAISAWQAARMALAFLAGSDPSCWLASAAAHLTIASARISSGLSEIDRPEMRKFSAARWVLMPHSAPEGISTVPRKSFSVRLRSKKSCGQPPPERWSGEKCLPVVVARNWRRKRRKCKAKPEWTLFLAFHPEILVNLASAGGISEKCRPNPQILRVP